MKCDRCKFEFDEKSLQAHHIHPRFMDNPKGNGMKIYHCKKCHGITHSVIQNMIWNKLTPEQKKEVTQDVIKYGKRVGGIDG